MFINPNSIGGGESRPYDAKFCEKCPCSQNNNNVLGKPHQKFPPLMARPLSGGRGKGPNTIRVNYFVFALLDRRAVNFTELYSLDTLIYNTLCTSYE